LNEKNGGDKFNLKLDTPTILNVESVSTHTGDYGDYLKVVTDEGRTYLSGVAMSNFNDIVGDIEAPFNVHVMLSEVETKNGRTCKTVKGFVIEGGEA